MNSYRNRVQRYRKSAEQNFNNFGGNHGGPRPGGGNPYMDSLHGHGGQDHNNYGGNRMPAGEILDPNDRTLTIVVTNTSTDSQTVRLFGSNVDLTDAAVPAAVTIQVLESSHRQVKNELLANPFRIFGLKFVVSNATQFNNPWTLTEQNATGGLSSKLWQPLNYRSAQNQLTDQIDAPTFELLVNAKTSINYTIVGAGASAATNTFTFSLSEKGEIKNILRGKDVRKVATIAGPTGLPQIDMMGGYRRM